MTTKITRNDLGLVSRAGKALITCPRCGADTLQHLGVAVFERESATTPLQLKVDTRRANVSVGLVSATTEDNPSAEGNGLAIQLFCATCSDGETDDIELTLEQTGASTAIGWRFPPLAAVK